MRTASYRSKVNPLLGGITAAAVLVSLTALGQELLGASTIAEALVPGFFLLLLVGVVALLLPMRYVIGPEELMIQSGVLRQRIPLTTIRRVYASNSVLASPAWSLDRLAIEHQAGRYSRPTVYISPKHKERFVEELAGAAGLKRSGVEWVRVEST